MGRPRRGRRIQGDGEESSLLGLELQRRGRLVWEEKGGGNGGRLGLEREGKSWLRLGEEGEREREGE